MCPNCPLLRSLNLSGAPADEISNRKYQIYLNMGPVLRDTMYRANTFCPGVPGSERGHASYHNVPSNILLYHDVQYRCVIMSDLCTNEVFIKQKFP